MRIIDTSASIMQAYENGHFQLPLWERYMDAHLPGAKELCLADLRECLDGGLSWEKEYLPVLDALAKDKEGLEKALSSFQTVTQGLDARIEAVFGRSADTDVVLYLGLCSGAGWVTSVGGRITILLGLEKILELGWTDVDAMNGLILHELGHVWQAQYGVLHRELSDGRASFLWQLFTEGIAMVFEQMLVGDENYFHQDKDGWKAWCGAHIGGIARDFQSDLGTMTRMSQRYFGDWVFYEGRSDVGYFLGADFVRFLMKRTPFDALLSADIGFVDAGFSDYVKSLEKR